MPVFANVNGKIRKLYRVFFNDNGVIREVESLHAQNDNNEIEELFVRSSSIPRVLQWVAYDDGTTINSVTNNGYAINGRFTEHKRSVSTSNKIYLSANTRIKVNFSNTIFDTSFKPPIDYVSIYLFKNESTTPSQSSEHNILQELTVKTSGDYYVAFALWWEDNDGNKYYYDTNVDITILPP